MPFSLCRMTVNSCSTLLLCEEGCGNGRVSFCYHHSCTIFTVSGTTECRSTMNRRSSSGTEPHLLEAFVLMVPSRPFHCLFQRLFHCFNIWTLVAEPVDEGGAVSRCSSLQTRSKTFEKTRRAIRLRCGFAAWKLSVIVCVILRIRS